MSCDGLASHPVLFCLLPSQVNLLLKEYVLSGDVVEAERCLRELEVPHFHHEFVYEVRLTFLCFYAGSKALTVWPLTMWFILMNINIKYD